MLYLEAGVDFDFFVFPLIVINKGRVFSCFSFRDPRVISCLLWQSFKTSFTRDLIPAPRLWCCCCCCRCTLTSATCLSSCPYGVIFLHFSCSRAAAAAPSLSSRDRCAVNVDWRRFAFYLDRQCVLPCFQLQSVQPWIVCKRGRERVFSGLETVWPAHRLIIWCILRCFLRVLRWTSLIVKSLSALHELLL